MQTQTSEYFSGLRNSLTGLAVDYARAKLIDVETRSDDKQIPDAIDAKLARDQAIGGMSIGAWVLVAAVAVVGLIVLKRVL